MSNPAIRIYSTSLDLIGELDNYSSAYYERTWSRFGQFSIQTDARTANAEFLAVNRIVVFDKNVYKAGIITSISKTTSHDNRETLTASGYELKYIFSWRQILPSAGSATYTISNSAETCMKTLVKDQCGSTADADRQFSNLEIATDADRGSTYTINNRYSGSIADELSKISVASGVGFFCYINESTKNITFEIGEGINRVASQSTNGRAIFSKRFDSLKSGRLDQTDNQYRNYAFVAGQGVAAARNVREVYTGAAEPTGFDRREMFVDARDLSANAALDQRGAQTLQEFSTRIIVDGSPLQESPFVYGQEYDLGDVVTVEIYDISYDARITEVKESWSQGSYELDVVFNKNKETITQQFATAQQSTRAAMNNNETGGILSKVFTGTTASAANAASTPITHGIDTSKIIGSSLVVNYSGTGSSSLWVDNTYPTYETSLDIAATTLRVYNHTTNANARSKPYVAIIWYTQ